METSLPAELASDAFVMAERLSFSSLTISSSVEALTVTSVEQPLSFVLDALIIALSALLLMWFGTTSSVDGSVDAVVTSSSCESGV